MRVFEQLYTSNLSRGAKSWVTMFWRDWARKDLKPGDLSALRELCDTSRWHDPSPARLQRLSNRGLIAKRNDDKVHVTMKGRTALLLGWR
jgi:hypothetical protein